MAAAAAAVVVEEAATAGAGGEEIKPYTIHVSSRYLDLTKQKLEITRLPHELSEPNSEDWWEPKPQVEPLIDFWLEQYSWRAQEDELNSRLPQFRTRFAIPQIEAPVRLHFIHIRSSHSNAIPLLLIPPFPFTNLSFGHITKLFTHPEDAATHQPFHLIIPSLPGLGFSDALPNNTPVISATGEILNSLMARLEYPHYLVTNVASGSASPAEIDWQLANYLATQVADSCLGVHFISPPLAQPKLQEAPLEWAKWSIASFFRAPILGYRSEDFSALQRNRPGKKWKKSPTPTQFGLNQLGLREPNTLAYALCDSPTGLLVFALKSLRLLGSKQELTSTEIINFTQLAWLPGPEAAMRFWAHSSQHPETFVKKVASRPKVAITVFLGDGPEGAEVQTDDAEAHAPPKLGIKDGYACPSWANAKYNVVYAHRAAGKSGLLAWERPELIAAGVRGLANEVLKLDPRLKPTSSPETVPLERVVSSSNEGGTAPSNEVATTLAAPPEPSLQPPTPEVEEVDRPIPPTNDWLLAPIAEEDRLHPQRGISEETRVGSDNEEISKSLMAKSDDTLTSMSPDMIHVNSPLRVP
ncbi:epoxide hydrolase [Xylariales sp. AK1849]|nr:epoxide hydrolase [Xylariales sp. AK1849]